MLTNRTIADRAHELADVAGAGAAVDGQAQAPATAYTTSPALRQKRTRDGPQLGRQPLRLERALHEVARTMPADAWLTSMRGTVTPAPRRGRRRRHRSAARSLPSPGASS